MSDDAQAIIDIATAAAPLQFVAPGLLAGKLPDNATIGDLDLRAKLEGAQPAPNARRGDYQFHDADSFVAYIRAQGLYGGATAVYADRPEIGTSLALRIVAVLNGHGDRPGEVVASDGETHAERGALGEPGWGDHRALFVPEATIEWSAWMAFTTAGDGTRWHDQLAFAEFVEDHAVEIRDPDAATAMGIARSLDVKRDEAFRTAVRTQDGNVNLAFDQTTTATAGQNVSVPEAFTLGLRPFDGADPFEVKARLRYRMLSGKVALGFALLRPDLVVRTAWDDAVNKVRTETGVPVYLGVAAPVDRA